MKATEQIWQQDTRFSDPVTHLSLLMPIYRIRKYYLTWVNLSNFAMFLILNCKNETSETKWEALALNVILKNQKNKVNAVYKMFYQHISSVLSPMAHYN